MGKTKSENFLICCPLPFAHRLMFRLNITELGEKQGLLTPEQGDMIHSIFEFKDTIVREVMVPRTEMLAVSSDVSIQTIIDLTLEHGHSRLPIFEENSDNIVGMLHVN